MKLLLDENLSKRLRRDLLPHEVWHVCDKKWQGKKNGELLAAMLEDEFDALITIDKNLQFQQDFARYPIPVLVLMAFDNTHPTVQLFAPGILQFLEQAVLPVGATEISI